MWLYKDKVIEKIEDFPANTFGFVYMITHIPTGKKYIGKKALHSNQNKKLGKKELAALPTARGRKPSTKKVIKESDWKTYFSSCKPILEMVGKGKEKEFKREILFLVTNKRMLTYHETKLLFTNEVLEHPDMWFNDNIEGRYFSKDFAG